MLYPALDVSGVDAELLEALVDDFAPTAIELHDDRVTIFFTDGEHRDRARGALVVAWPGALVQTCEVDDEDWPRRSQENLTPVTVGRITVAPPWHASSHVPEVGPHASAVERPITLVITPSMGFGTGHHATTRLCLMALQGVDLAGRRVFDVGTGSGVLAIAARAMGASPVTAIDYDRDALQSARENLAANPAVGDVELVEGDLRDVPVSSADVVVANLMGSLLVTAAPVLAAAVNPGGTLIVSGLLDEERETVVRALSSYLTPTWEGREEGWVALAFNRNGGPPV